MIAKELRIGNYVFEYEDDELTNIDCWEFERARLENTPNEMNWLYPIPLTEEWLLKFGLKLNDCDNYETEYTYRLNMPFIVLDREDGYYYIDAPNMRLEYVHQLQNLYFALTGEELNIKEPSRPNTTSSIDNF